MKLNRILAALAAFITSMSPSFAQEQQYLYGYGSGGAALVTPAGTAVLTGGAGQGTLTTSRFVGYTVTSATSITAVINNAYQTTAASPAVALPPAAGLAGQTVYFYNNHGSSTNVTITPHGTDDINGSNSAITVANGSKVELISDGVSNWYSL
jgi:hypothetical protein